MSSIALVLWLAAVRDPLLETMDAVSPPSRVGLLGGKSMMAWETS